MTKLSSDRGLMLRMVATMAVLVVVDAAILLPLIVLPSPQDAVPLLIGAVAVIVVVTIQGRPARAALRRSAGAAPADQARHPRLHGAVDRLCALADMPKPEILIVKAGFPSAFTTGKAICVPDDMPDRLTAAELDAVLAHELGHLAHLDAAVLEAAAAFGLALARLESLLEEDHRKNWSPAVPVLSFLYGLSMRLVLLLSRYRELAADRTAALLTGRPSTLASALVKQSDELGRIPETDLRAIRPYQALLCIGPPLPEHHLGRWRRWPGPLASAAPHPPLRQRLDHLAALSSQLGSEGSNL